MKKNSTLAVIVILCLFMTAAAAPSSARPLRVHIAELANLSASEDTYWLGPFIASALEKNLGMLPDIRITRNLELQHIEGRGDPRDEIFLSTLCAAARSADVDFVLGGDFHEGRGVVSVNAFCVSSDGEKLIDEASFVSSYSDLHDSLAGLSILLAGSLGVEYTKDQSARIGRAPTKSHAGMSFYGKAMSASLADERRILLLRAIFEDSDYTDALSKLGVHYYQAGNPSDSLHAFEALESIDPQYPHLYYNLGLVYRSRKEYSRAIEMYHKALESEPDDSDAWNNLGATYYLAGMREEAAYAFERALELDPGDKNARMNLRSLTGDRDDRSKTYRPATIGSLRQHIDTGAALYANGEYWRAEEEFKKAIAIDPDGFEANNNIALTYMKLGEFERARTHFQRALKADPTAIDVEENLAKLSQRIAPAKTVSPEDTQSAGTDLDPARKAQALSIVGGIYLSRGANEQAADAFSRALDLCPDSVEALVGLGSAYFELGEYEKAGERFSEALDLEPDSEIARQKIVEIEYVVQAESNEDAAGQSLPSTISVEAEARALHIRANRLCEGGKYEKAVAEYLRALDLTPASPVILNNLAGAYSRMGRYEEARAALEKAERLDPSNEMIGRNLDALEDDGAETIELEMFPANPAADDAAGGAEATLPNSAEIRESSAAE